MSYGGEMVAGAIALAVAVPLIAVGTMARSAVSVGRAAAKAAHDARQTARVNSAERELGKMTAQAEALEAQMHTEMDAAMEECYADYEHTMQELSETYRKEPDTAAFAAGCRAAHEKLCQDMREKRSVLERETIGGIQREMKIRQQTLAQERRDMQDSMQRMQDDMARRERAGELARAELAQTAQMLEDLNARCSESASGRAAYEACCRAYDKAEASLAEGLPEAALSQAYALKDTILLRVQEYMEAECRTMRLHTDCTAMLSNFRQMMQEHEKISYTFRETCSGKERELEIEDFPRYYRGAWEQLTQELGGWQEQLTAENYRDYAPEHLMELLDRMGDWQARFMQETATAYERLHNLLLRRETAKLLVKRYAEKGYQLIPLTEEDRAVSDLDSRIIRLEHAETGERLYLRLNAETDAEGHVAMHIDIEDHTEYEGNYFEVERARAKEREANCGMIRQSNVGKQLQLRHRCTNPGVRDTYQKPQS